MSADTGMSELESEFELEMEDSKEFEDTNELEESREFEELKEFEDNRELEESRESEEKFELESDKELEQEFEKFAELERQEEHEGETDRFSNFADRFNDLSNREFESEFELNTEIDRLLEEMEREYFWGKLKKIGKRFVRGAMRMAKSLPAFQAVRAASQLARGNLKGMLRSLAKSALPMAVSAIPGGAAALPALKALGFEAEDPDSTRVGWRNFVEVSQEAYDHLAKNINEKAVDPVEANRQASSAFKYGLSQVQSKGKRPYSGSRGKVYRIRVKRGERVRLVIVGR